MLPESLAVPNSNPNEQECYTSLTHLGEDGWCHQKLKVLLAAISQVLLMGDPNKIYTEQRERQSFQVFSFHRTVVVPARFLLIGNIQLPLMGTTTVRDKGRSFVRCIESPVRSVVVRWGYKIDLM
jgi:hypothetical protein